MKAIFVFDGISTFRGIQFVLKINRMCNFYTLESNLVCTTVLECIGMNFCNILSSQYHESSIRLIRSNKNSNSAYPEA